MSHKEKKQTFTAWRVFLWLTKSDLNHRNLGHFGQSRRKFATLLCVQLVTIPLLTCWPQRVISLCQETNAIFCENRLPPCGYFLKQSFLMTSSLKFLICHLKSLVNLLVVHMMYSVHEMFTFILKSESMPCQGAKMVKIPSRNLGE